MILAMGSIGEEGAIDNWHMAGSYLQYIYKIGKKWQMCQL
jgi:hypothetical protein